MRSADTPEFDNSYARLPARFYTRQEPRSVRAPTAIRVNHSLAVDLGFDPSWLASEQGLAFGAGNFLPNGADPLASVYAGHQFGGWSSRLGDGRVLLLGEVIDSKGARYDVQLKGSGQTPYSRGGDGRSPLGPVLREYILSEAMAALGVPTTRALCATGTGEMVEREERLPGAVLVRVAKSHIRIGTVQYFAARKDEEALQLLVEHVIHRHYPDAASAKNPVLALLDCIVAAQARLVAMWQSLGFIHGVMNTDNMLLSGETIDYGPCAFMEGFDVNAVYSSIDRDGRYAYSNQPTMTHWNLAQLTQALLPLLDKNEEKALLMGQEVIDSFPGLYMAENQKNMQAKLGLSNEQSEDRNLIKNLLELLQEHGVDYTLMFRRLSEIANPEQTNRQSVSSFFEIPGAFASWTERWMLRLREERSGNSVENMLQVNPVYIPRNHLVQEAIENASTSQNFDTFHALVDILANPFDFDMHAQAFALPAKPEQLVRQTFCGT